MTGYVLAENADADLVEIFRVTQDRWGTAQAERYIHSMFETFDRLVQHKELGRARTELGVTIRSFAHRRHVIYYSIMPEGLGIARVLHGAMDVENAGLFEE